MADFRALSAAFGGTVFAEDYRGDLNRVDQTLEGLKRAAEVDPESEAAILLLRTVHNALCGRLALARTCLEDLERLTGNLPLRWALRSRVYRAYLLTLRRFPPFIRFRPELGGTAHLDRMLVTDYENGAMTFHMTTRAQTGAGVPFQDLDYLELWIMGQLLSNSMQLWCSAFILHPNYAPGPWNRNVDAQIANESATQLSRLVDMLQTHLNAAEMLNMSDVAFNISMRMWEFANGSANTLTMHLLHRMEQYSANYRDLAGQGMCKLLAGDRLLSPPFSNPVALNLIPIDGDDAGCTNGLWDPIEAGLTLQINPLADELYRKAYELFRRANAQRGCGAALLRQACVQHMQICSLQTSIASGNLNRQFNQVEAKLTAAQWHFGLDTSHVNMVRGHKILLSINRGISRNIAQMAATIGDWGRTNENEGVAQFVGFLLMRFGRKQWVDDSRVETALSCFRCAQVLFSTLGSLIPSFQAFVAQVQVQVSLSNIAAAKTLVDRHMLLFDQVMRHIDDLRRKNLSPTVRRQLLLLRKNLLVTLGDLIRSLYYRARDFSAVDRWEKRMSDWDKDREMQSEVGTAAQDSYIQKHVLSGKVFILGEAMLDQKLFGKYLSANERYKKTLSMSDIEEAERIMRQCGTELKDLPGSLYVRWVLPLSAHFMIGETPRCQALLSELPDSELLDERIQEISGSDAAWSQTRHNTRLQNVSSAENAVALCAMATDWDRGAQILSRILELAPGFLEEDSGERTEDLWHRYFWTGLIAEQNFQHRVAYERYSSAARMVSSRRSHTTGQDARIASFSNLNLGEVFMGLVRVTLQCADTGIPFLVANTEAIERYSVRSWTELALVFLEESRARSLLDNLTSQGALGQQESRGAIALEAYKRRLLIYLQALPPSEIAEEERKELTSLEESLNGIETGETDSSSVPISVGGSMQLPDCFAAISQDVLLVELGFSRFGSVILALASSGIVFAKLFPFRDVDIRRPVLKTLKCIKEFSRTRKNTSSRLLTACLQEISDLLISPIANIIRQKKHIVFAAGQPLTAFPFAALPLDNQPLFLAAAISITPSLASFYQLSRRAPQLSPKVTAVVKPGSDVDHINTGERPLPMAGIECMNLFQLFGSTPHLAKKLSRKAFCDLVSQSTIMHIATHGKLHMHSPWLSYISLKNKMRVIDLARVRRCAALIVFAACLSGLGQATVGNDVLGFSHAVLEAGATAFLGALWEVDDVATMLIMALFYRGIKAMRTDGTTIAELWKQAMVKFYSLTKESGKQMFSEMRVLLEECKSKGLDPEKVVGNADGELLRAETELNVDFKHPFYYASFIMVGFGGLTCRWNA